MAEEALEGVVLVSEGWVTLTRGLMDEGRLTLMDEGWLAPWMRGG